MVVYHFPPAKSPSLRSYYIYLECKKHFKAVKVIRSKNIFLAQENMPVEEEDITPVVTFDYRNILKLFNRNKVGKFENKKSKTTTFLIKLFDSFPFNLILGEGGFVYIITALINAVHQIKKHKISHIYSSFRPYSAHVVAWFLKIMFPKIYWIADFRDLHIDPTTDSLFFKNLQKWFNKKVLSKANVVTTVSAGLAEHLIPFNKNVYILNNGINNNIKHLKVTDSFKTFTIAYTGSLYRDKRNPSRIFEALSELINENKIAKNQIDIIYAGKHGNTFRQWIQKFSLDHIFRDEGLITHRQALLLQKKSHLNLLLTHANKKLTGVLTGKIFEYLFAGRPILVMINGNKDHEIEEIIDSANAGIVVYNQSEDLVKMKEFILTLYHKWKTDPLPTSPIKKESLKPYTWEYIMDTFINKELSLQNKV